VHGREGADVRVKKILPSRAYGIDVQQVIFGDQGGGTAVPLPSDP
jgi:hypothetical protein